MLTVRKRLNVYEYRFEIAKIDHKQLKQDKYSKIEQMMQKVDKSFSST